MARKKEMLFEQALEQLEDIVKQLEENNLSLDESIELFQKGVELSGFCSKQLTDASGKVQKITEQKDGQLKLSLFEGEGD